MSNGSPSPGARQWNWAIAPGSKPTSVPHPSWVNSSQRVLRPRVGEFHRDAVVVVALGRAGPSFNRWQRAVGRDVEADRACAACPEGRTGERTRVVRTGRSSIVVEVEPDARPPVGEALTGGLSRPPRVVGTALDWCKWIGILRTTGGLVVVAEPESVPTVDLEDRLVGGLVACERLQVIDEGFFPPNGSRAFA